jgi:hypothetical protein
MAAIVCMIASPVFAQTNVGALSASGATAVIGGSTYNTTSTTRIPTPVPDAIAPAISTANPCSLGSSASVSFAGVGLGGGGSYHDDECNDQKWFALFYQASLSGGTPSEAKFYYQWWALSIACNQPRLREVAPKGFCEHGWQAQVPTSVQAPQPAATSQPVSPIHTAQVNRPNWCNQKQYKDYPQCR